jgi:replicative DNA helicase
LSAHTEVTWPAHIIPTDVERWVLGAIIVDYEKMLSALLRISSEDFYDPKCREVFDAIAFLQKIGKHVDLVTVSTRLKSSTKSTSWAVYISELVSDENVISVSQSQLDQWCDIIIGASRSRNLVLSMRETTQGLFRGQPLSECAESVHSAIFKAQNIRNEREHRDSLYVAKSSIALIEKIKTRGESGSPVKSHLKDVDVLIDSFAPGELIVVAARPSHGKTALVMQSAEQIAQQNERVAFISLEMPNNDLMLRLVSRKTGIPLHVIRGPYKLSPYQMSKITAALGELAELPIIFDDNSYENMVQLESKMEYLHARYSPSLFIVDYLQLIGTKQQKGERRKERHEIIGDYSAALKNFAKRHQVPVVVLSQLNRDLEKRPDKRPQLSDLKDSGSIEQDADKVMFVFRPAAFRESKPKKFIVHGKEVDIDKHAEIIIAKNRNGATGSALVEFRGTTVSFHDVNPTDESGQEETGEPF